MQPFTPTHIIFVPGQPATPVLLDEGRCYTAAEWDACEHADWTYDGRLLRLGQAVDGSSIEAVPASPPRLTAEEEAADEWRATLDGGHAGETTLDGALSLDEAWQEALDWARSCDWEGAEAGHEVRALLTVSRRHPSAEERQREVVVQDAETSEEVPPCVDGEDHDLGDPTTYSLGGTSYSHRETCRACKAVRVSLHHGSQRNPGDVDSVTWEPAPAPVVRCQCGEITGEACRWRGPIDGTEMVTWLPGQWRDTATACGDSWSGLARRLRLETSCAESLAKSESEGEWLLRYAAS